MKTIILGVVILISALLQLIGVELTVVVNRNLKRPFAK